MKLPDKLKFREMQMIFFRGMIDNPTDTNRLEGGFQVLEKFIDSLVERECSAIVAGMASIKSGGKIVGGSGNLKN